VNYLQQSHLNDTIAVLNDLEINVIIPEITLRSSLASMSTTVNGTTSAILYSGNLGVDSSAIYANNIANADSSVAILNKTDAFNLLDGTVFKEVLESSVGTMQFNNLINGSTDAVTGNRVPDSLWDDISREFTQNINGDVRTVTPNADAQRVFAQTELPALLDNPNVTTINGIEKQKIRGLC